MATSLRNDSQIRRTLSAGQSESRQQRLHQLERDTRAAEVLLRDRGSRGDWD